LWKEFDFAVRRTFNFEHEGGVRLKEPKVQQEWIRKQVSTILIHLSINNIFLHGFIN
jgi:hypothetical protein